MEWTPARIDKRELELRAAQPYRVWPTMKLVSGLWTIAKWNMSDARYALWKGKERWPKTGGFTTAQEAKDLAEELEREACKQKA